ncbi:hypothetical protein RFH95_10915 [Acinetobacter nosocomialis]|uniref:Uncharacterized protein n=1 Tax=Acinetobacter baumannii TaxID=470 RepID=A0A241ZA56_ACIBA|nr:MULTISPECIES: hypothetical protein [Acinetobacter calcoaceticus/baumannii complex]MBD0444898.1 hypothetical protein [Acinetobacter nosocomialis]MBR7696005.1 hypothetical protein [Acinetobacter nosocomialis]MCZ3293168.1 hypothetical protein [Acinetobacter baumannii]MDC4964894.1 hypothetical protein [Acinetobacter baumannii]MDH2552400.1 hypothetical protein [Acinetobacter baumannii]
MIMDVMTANNTITEAATVMDEIIADVVVTIINENDGSFDLTTKAGIDEAVEHAAYFYKQAGITLNTSDVRHALHRKLSSIKKFELA